MRRLLLPLLALLLAAPGPLPAQEKALADLLRGLEPRNIGPYMTSGRVAVNSTYSSPWRRSSSARTSSGSAPGFRKRS